MADTTGQQPIFLLNGIPDFSSAPKPEVIADLKRSKEVVDRLMREGQPIAVDAEGVNLGATGRLTLLQVGTIRREVYLFDVCTCKDLVNIGGLRELLESSIIIKVMHSCQGDSAALYHQFGVIMQNVFDTQAANTVIESYGNKVRFPKYLKLDDLVKKYGGTPSASKALQETWKYQHEYWAQRPLTTEMIDYAAGDVTVLMPVVYANMISEIQDKSLWAQLLVHVDEMIHEQIDPERVRAQRAWRKALAVNLTLTELELHWCGIIPPLHRLTPDQTFALWQVDSDDPNVSAYILELRCRLVNSFLSQAELALKEDPRKYLVCMTSQAEHRLKYLSKNGNSDLQDRAQQVLDKIESEKVLRAMEKLKRGHMLASWEKFMLLKCPLDIGVPDASELDSAKCVLVRNFEKSIATQLSQSMKNVKKLRVTDQAFLQLIPTKYISKHIVCEARDLLLAENKSVTPEAT